VVCGGLNVDVNTASLSEMTQNVNSSKGKKFPPDVKCKPPESDGKTATLDSTLTRAVVLGRLVSFLEARGKVRPLVAEHLAWLLNQNVTPQLRKGPEALADLANYCLQGAETLPVLQNGEAKTLGDCMAPLNVNVPGLTRGEHASFLSHDVLIASGIFALGVYKCGMLLDMADCVAALSCETIKAYTAPFAQFANDICRPHRGQITVAGNLRLLLTNSLMVNQVKRKERDPLAFRAIPEFHGPARDAYDAAVKACKIEINSAEATAFTEDASTAGNLFTPAPVLASLRSLLSAANVVTTASADRVQELLTNFAKYSLVSVGETGFSAELKEVNDKVSSAFSNLPAAVHSAGPQEFLQYVLAFEEVMTLLHHTLSLEAMTALQTLTISEKTIIEEETKKAAEKKAREEARLAQMAAEGKKVKAKPDKKKKEKTLGFVLGIGSASFRSFVCQQTSFSPVPVKDSLPAALEAFKLAFSPLLLPVRAQLEQLLTATNAVCKPKIPKGTRDAMPEQITIREKAFSIITQVFRRHGAVGIDTPVFERREILTGKYGEDSKLIYDLADQGGEQLCLRYDLTVPFARYIASNGIKQIKRYHIARVYRRDNPAMTKGRFREFYQCDYDIAGQYAPMVPDSDALKVACEILTDLRIGSFKIKLNHRKLLDGVMESCGVPPDKFRTICSAIDKLDKEPWETVREEMVGQKGLAGDVADRIGTYVTRPPEEDNNKMLEQLKSDALLSKHKGACEAFQDMEVLFVYLTAMGCMDKISFDLSLARGLDYYTGIIYEAMLTDTNRVGSIAAGGRYDNLVSMFSGSAVPCVGISIGIERIFTILEEQERARGNIRATQTQVLVASVGNNLLQARMQLCSELWSHNVKAEFLYDLNPKPKKQMDFVLENCIPFVVWIGEQEMEKGVVKLKDMEAKAEVEVPRADIAKVLAAKTAQLANANAAFQDAKEEKRE